MHIDLYVAVAGAAVGFVVGLTGMGGGALMTPVLVLFFHVQALAAVSSDLVASVLMKPVGAAVHLRRRTVDGALVRWLCVGSVPAAFAGVFVLRALPGHADVQHEVKIALGSALLVAAVAMVAKSVFDARRAARGGQADTVVHVRPALTVLVGAFGGLIVGMTSVGSGSLIIVLLLFLYPGLRAGRLVGTDLVQAIPMVGAAALAHVLYGDFKLGLTLSLLIGAVPGVYVGARSSVVAPAGLIRRALVAVLVVSSLKLVGVGNTMLVGATGAVVLLAVASWLLPRWQRRPGSPYAGEEPTGTTAREEHPAAAA